MSGSHESNTNDEDDGSDKEEEERNSTLTVTGTIASQFSTRTRSRFIPLPGAKSKVWKYFAFEADDNDKIQNNTNVFCQVPNCNARIGYSKNTTNMSLHLKRHHPTHYQEVQVVSDDDDSAQPDTSKPTHWQSRITDAFYSVEPYRKNNPRYKACEEALAKFVCLDLQPLSIVSSPSFLQLLKTLDPKFTPLSASQFSRVVVPTLYEKTKSKVKNSSVTTDAWTGCHNRSYISVTTHFIDPLWNLKHYCLQIQEITESHTAVNLADDLRNSGIHWSE